MVERKEEESHGLAVMIKLEDDGVRAGITGKATRDDVVRVVGTMDLLKHKLLSSVVESVDRE